MLFNILVHAHSGLRWIVLLLLVYNILNALMGMQSKRSVTTNDKRISAIGMGVFHLQFVLGLVLYFMSPRVQFSANTMGNDQLRFFTIEHAFGMLVAVILITVGNRMCKAGSFKGEFWYYLVTLIVLLASIPWPFRGFGNGWF